MDQASHEAIAEQNEEYKRVYKPMKDFYMKRNALQEKYGSFPLFWQDFPSWSPYKEIFRFYNRWAESGIEPLVGSDYPNVTAATVNSSEVASSNVNIENEQKNAVNEVGTTAPAPVKKRKRWGDLLSPAEAPVAKRADTVVAPVAASSPKFLRDPKWLPLPAAKPNRCRWGSRAVNALASLMPNEATPAQERLFVLRIQVEEIHMRIRVIPAEVKRIEERRALRSPRSRSPSPEPEYDSNGKLINSREQRLRKALNAEMGHVLEKMVDLNPSIAGGLGPRFLRKIYIPVKEYPNYNFIGLIIGPRGHTQKKLEAQTNCRISVRGRGSGKSEKGSEDEDLHVVLQGTRLSEVEAAARLISDILKPIDDNDNEWKKKQLIELASMNGTLRDINAPCSICGEPGHRHYECPQAELSRPRAGVLCSICGDGGHIASDCKLNPKNRNAAFPGEEPIDDEEARQEALNTLQKEAEYKRFMADMGDEEAKESLVQLEKQIENLKNMSTNSVSHSNTNANGSSTPGQVPAARNAPPVPPNAKVIEPEDPAEYFRKQMEKMQSEKAKQIKPTPPAPPAPIAYPPQAVVPPPFSSSQPVAPVAQTPPTMTAEQYQQYQQYMAAVYYGQQAAAAGYPNPYAAYIQQYQAAAAAAGWVFQHPPH